VWNNSTTDFALRITHSSSSGTIGCGQITVHSDFDVVDAWVTGASSGDTWSASVSGNRVQVLAPNGGARLALGSWLDVVIRARAEETGDERWTAAMSASTSAGCAGHWYTNTIRPRITVSRVPDDGYPDVDPETADVAPGDTVTLEVHMRRIDGSHARYREGNRDVHFVFLPGSANDQEADPDDPDMTCDTGWDAICSVSYVAANAGVDVICAFVGRPDRWDRECDDEPWNAADLGDDADTIRRVVAVPLPVVVQTPQPVPTPLPTPAPTPVAAPPPPPAVTPVPAPVPSPEATPTPTAEPVRDAIIPLVAADDTPVEPPAAAPPPVQQPSDPAAAPAAPPTADDEGAVLGQIWEAATDGISRAVSPEAAAQVAKTFGFPLALMLAVLLFLIVQDRVDRRDPKLQTAPRTVFDTVVRFKEEHEL
jgi:hypothetical protein